MFLLIDHVRLCSAYKTRQSQDNPTLLHVGDYTLLVSKYYSVEKASVGEGLSGVSLEVCKIGPRGPPKYGALIIRSAHCAWLMHIGRRSKIRVPLMAHGNYKWIIRGLPYRRHFVRK